MTMKLTVLLTAAAAALATPAAAHGPMSWDGSNPFECELQQLGTGVDYPDPGADPLCVEFDKTNQDLAGLGVVSFLLNEPARIAAALDKCFYYQRDEWRGSVLVGGELETYHWDGRYYFDKARGAGGVHLENVRVAGQSAEPALFNLVPPPFNAFFTPTGGGGQVVFDVPADPRCAS